MVRNLEEKSAFDLGVKSLPRLILRDTEHIVRSEGFGIEDIADKIKNIKQKCDFARKTMSTISKWGRVCLAAVITFYMSSVCVSATSKDEFSVRPNAKELVNLYKKAVTCWDKSVAMRVELVHSYAKRGIDETDIRHWKYDITHRRDGDRCEWFGSCEFKGQHDGEDYSFNEQFTKIVGDDFFLSYTRRQLGGQPAVMTQALMGSDVNEMLFVWHSLGYEGDFLLARMDGIGSASKMAELLSDSDGLKLIGQETLSGSLCYIVETQTIYGTFTVWITPEKGFNALKYVVRRRGHDILRDDIHFDDQGITECVEVADSIDVRKIGGVFIPISGKLTDNVKAGDDWESTDHVEVKRSEIVLNPDFKALGAFKISFPEGTEVTHQDIPGLRFRWTNGKFVPEMNKYLFKSLAGKPLPSFERIITGFDPNSTTGKMVLVCFFDMNQRPSRHCIVQLGKRAQELKSKDMSIVTVQISKIDENALNEWLKDQNISFPVGMVANDEQAIRFTWGVKSLPWLILTNKEHIIIAEGFSISELYEKMSN
jgi:hypothetical protein